MTSEERHEGRYQRRKAKRTAKAMPYKRKTFDEVMSFENLCRAGTAACNSARWKSSTIHFEANLVGECETIYETVHNLDSRTFGGFRSFDTVEHGKLRQIDALPIQERTAQKCLCHNLLIDAYRRSFVYDNGASLEERGMDFTLKRLRKHLGDHFRRFGLDGGIFQFDFSGYFGSLPHDGIKARARERIGDDKLYDLFCAYVDDFQRRATAETEGPPRGVGLGSEISQIIALDYADPIDHYIKDYRGVHGYGRYMDDGYVISNDLNALRSIRDDVIHMASDLGISLNERKCTITPFRHHSFTFLKMRISLKETGRVVMKLGKKAIRAMRRKLHIFRRWLDSGRLDSESIFQSYQSWRAHAKRCNSHDTLHGMDTLFVRLFEPELAMRRLVFPCTIPARMTTEGWQYELHRSQTVPGTCGKRADGESETRDGSAH